MTIPDARPRPRWRRIMAAIVAACCVAYLFLFVQLHARAGQAFPSPSSSSSSTTASLSNNLHLTEKECRAAFPGLMDPIDKQVRRGPFPLHPASDLGPLQARVRNGRLRILSAEKHSMLPPELLDARVATLHQIERALLTAPSSPGGANALDTFFSVNVQDQPYGSAWTYSLPAYAAPTAGNAPIGRAFLMPHFSFWAWRPRMVGSFARAAAAIDAIETRLPFARKQAQAVWRGTARFASAHHPALRTDLLKATRGQPWADVQELAWLPEVVDSDKDNATRAVNALAMQDASNGLMIEDFCRYKYVVHTEGITYSGRFQFHQLCGSVVLTAPLAWMQHTTHLVRPLYASDVLGGDAGDAGDAGNAGNRRVRGGLVQKTTPRSGAAPTPDEEKAWPHAAPDAANIVFVAPDWSNLGAMVQWLEDHPAVAEGIARRQRSLFASGPHGRGYLSPAAEVCYWRALLAGWRQVVQYNDTEVGEGVPWELFSLEPRW